MDLQDPQSADQAGPAPGGCLCGAVRFLVHGALRDVLICHCTMCQKQHTHAGAYTACEPDDVEMLETDGLRWHAASRIASRGFCGVCGSGLFWKPAGGTHLSIAVGSLDDPSDLKFDRHIFTDEKSHLYAIAGDET